MAVVNRRGFFALCGAIAAAPRAVKFVKVPSGLHFERVLPFRPIGLEGWLPIPGTFVLGVDRTVAPFTQWGWIGAGDLRADFDHAVRVASGEYEREMFE